MASHSRGYGMADLEHDIPTRRTWRVFPINTVRWSVYAFKHISPVRLAHGIADIYLRF